MSMGKVIERRRKELGLTQTKVADALGVSTPAVNRWEKGNGMPDAGLMAPLARLLRIDMNKLFSFYEALPEDEVEKICTELNDTMVVQGRVSDGIKRIEEIVKQNPSDANLCYKMAEMLAVVELMKKEAELCRDKSILLCERAIELDPQLKSEAIPLLITHYDNKGDFDKAEYYWNMLDDKHPDKRWIYAEMLQAQGKYKEAAIVMKSYVMAKTFWLAHKVGTLQNTLSLCGDFEMAEKAETVFDDLIKNFESLVDIYQATQGMGES